ncbi:MAG: DUF1631 family protein [Pseudomonadota bacterium]
MKLAELFHFNERQDAPAAHEHRRRSAADAAEVDQVLTQLAGTQQLPAALEKLIYQYWKKVLQAVYREHGRSSRQWSVAMQITLDLLWSLTPKHTEEERKHLIAVLPGLIQSVQAGLSAVIRDPATVDKAMVVLGKQHLICLQKSESSTRAAPRAPAVSAPQFDILDPALTDDTRIELANKTKVIDPKKYAPGLIKATGGWVFDPDTQEWVFIGE